MHDDLLLPQHLQLGRGRPARHPGHDAVKGRLADAQGVRAGVGLACLQRGTTTTISSKLC